MKQQRIEFDCQSSMTHIRNILTRTKWERKKSAFFRSVVAIPISIGRFIHYAISYRGT